MCIARYLSDRARLLVVLFRVAVLLVLFAFCLLRVSSCSILTTCYTCQLDSTNDSLWSVYQLETLEGELVNLDSLTQF